MIKHKFKLDVRHPNAAGKLVGTGVKQTVTEMEGATYAAFRETEKSVSRALWKEWQNIHNQGVGQTGMVGIIVQWECTWNGRAPARPKHVIAAEKAARAVKSAAKQAQKAKWEEERLRQQKNVRIRIQRQIDHAFAVGAGKAGSAPVNQFITCEHCDAPATVLRLKTPMPKGAHMLDEELITGALCAQHGAPNQWDKTEKIPCSRLEFLYDGVRAIALKP